MALRYRQHAMVDVGQGQQVLLLHYEMDDGNLHAHAMPYNALTSWMIENDDEDLPHRALPKMLRAMLAHAFADPEVKFEERRGAKHPMQNVLDSVPLDRMGALRAHHRRGIPYEVEAAMPARAIDQNRQELANNGWKPEAVDRVQRGRREYAATGRRGPNPLGDDDRPR